MTTSHRTGKSKRISRLLNIIQEVRNCPGQNLHDLINRLGISKSQFYKDKNTLKELGFDFQYSPRDGFTLKEDRFALNLGLSLSERLLLMFSLGNLCRTGDNYLSSTALQVGRKLAGDLKEPFRSQVIESFNETVIRDRYGCNPELLEKLEKSVEEGRRLHIKYDSRSQKLLDWIVIDPLRIYFMQRNLYMYAACPMSSRKYKVFKVNRIKQIRKTGTCISRKGDGGFHSKMKNAFFHFIGDSVEKVVLRIPPHAAEYVAESFWHESQKFRYDQEGYMIFSVEVAEPREVYRWGMSLGMEGVEVLEPEWLREEALYCTNTLIRKYAP